MELVAISDAQIEQDHSTESFIRHMVSRGNEAGLRRYADLVFAGLVANPEKKARRREGMALLWTWTTKCKRCGKPVTEQGDVPIDDRCKECEVQLEALVAVTRANLAMYREVGFCQEGGPPRR